MTLEVAIDSLEHYAKEGRPTGGFLRAVLDNNLMKAVLHADDSSLVNLKAICCYVFDDMPDDCHGSPEAVTAWMARKLEERQTLKAQP